MVWCGYKKQLLRSLSRNSSAWKSTESQVEKNTTTFWCVCIFRKHSRAANLSLQVIYRNNKYKYKKSHGELVIGTGTNTNNKDYRSPSCGTAIAAAGSA